MYGKFLKCLISQLVAPIEVFFIPLPPKFDRLHENTKIFAVTLLPEVIKETITVNST